MCKDRRWPGQCWDATTFLASLHGTERPAHLQTPLFSLGLLSILPFAPLGCLLFFLGFLLLFLQGQLQSEVNSGVPSILQSHAEYTERHILD